MLDWREIEGRVHELIRGKKLTEAEAVLLTCYSELREGTQTEELDYVVGALAQFYAAPETEDTSKAEQFFLEREKLSSDKYSKLQTATFYFYVLQDFSKTVDKVNEIRGFSGWRGSASYYSGLGLKGQALLELNRVEEVALVLDEMLAMAEPSDARLPYGDEINFLERAMREQNLRAKSRALLVSISSRIRSREYEARAKSLLG